MTDETMRIENCFFIGPCVVCGKTIRSDQPTTATDYLIVDQSGWRHSRCPCPAEIRGWQDADAQAERERQRRLIAASEPLAALKALLAHDGAEDCQECGIGKSQAWQDAKAAVAKAEGKP